MGRQKLIADMSKRPRVDGKQITCPTRRAWDQMVADEKSGNGSYITLDWRTTSEFAKWHRQQKDYKTGVIWRNFTLPLNPEYSGACATVVSPVLDRVIKNVGGSVVQVASTGRFKARYRLQPGGPRRSLGTYNTRKGAEIAVREYRIKVLDAAYDKLQGIPISNENRYWHETLWKGLTNWGTIIRDGYDFDTVDDYYDHLRSVTDLDPAIEFHRRLVANYC